MSHHCHSNSCSAGHHHSHHSHHGDCSCDCHQGCQCPCHQGHDDNFAAILLQAADEAWLEVLKEKIKEEIQKQSGAQLNKLAKLVAEANHKRWQDKMCAKKSECSFEETLEEFFYSEHKKK